MPTTRSASRSRSSPTAPSTPTPLSTTVTSPPPQRPVGRSSRLSQRLSTAHDTGSPSVSMSPLRERSSRALNKQSSVSMAEELLVDKALPQELDDKVSLTTESIENRARNEETIESSSKANHASTSTLPVTPSRRSTRSMSRTPMNLPVDTTASSSRRRASRMRSESVAPEVASGEAVAAHTRSHDMKGSAAGEATDNAQLRPASADRDRGRQGFRNAFTNHSNDVSPTVLTPTITTTSLPPNLHVQTMNQDTTPSANKEIAIDSDSQDEEVTPRALQPPLPNLSQDMQSDVDSGISSDIESEEDEDSDAEVLLSRAIQAASRSKAVLQGKDAQPVHENLLEGGDEQDLWLLEAESSESKQKRMQEKAIPGVSIPSASRMPLHHLSLGPSDKKGKKRLELVAERATRRESGRVVGSGSHPIETTKDRETDDRQYEKEQSRQDKLKLAPRQTKSQAWSSLPPIPSALLPQMKRDYQALALRDSLDPKRFMKGKTKAVPEHFAIGTLVAPPRHLQSTTIQRERAYRPGDIVQSIVDDSELGVFAKRKFDDFAGKKMEHGRGQGWKKRKGASWK